MQLGRCDNKGQLLYSLYGIVEHSGGMKGGHYTAYVRTRTPIKREVRCVVSGQQQGDQERRETTDNGCQSEATGGGSEADGGSEFDLSSTGGQWHFISDSRVRTASESEALKSQAYLLFYEQLPLSYK